MATAQAESVERGYRSLSSLFRPVVIDSKKCHRCNGPVYHVEKIGPVHDVLFHKSCFKCIVCGQSLNLKNYYSNQVSGHDREVYCSTHVPRVGAARIDQGAMGIKSAMNAQKDYVRMSKKSNQQVRDLGTIRGPHYDYEAVAIKRATTAPKAHDIKPPINDEIGFKASGIDAEALHIRGPIDAQLLAKGYQRKLDTKHHYPPNIYKKKQRLIDAQKKLEEEFRKEEDKLLQEIHKTRKQESRRLSDELNKEWEVKLKELTEKFEREMSTKKKKKDTTDLKHLTMNFENQKKEIASSLAVKKEKKKESMTLRLREKEQRKTAELVTKQSKEMLELLAAKQEELKQELKQELEKDSLVPIEPINGQTAQEEQVDVLEQALEALEITDTEIPPPHPPSCRKKDLFTSIDVFKDIDEQVIKVAEGEQMTYTDLVQQLTENLVTDLEKVRAIYRWITVKDLNVMEFDESLQTDTPMGLLRGIKYGTETYHVLFLRLCSYTGLHCVEVKGHSKSVGYEPGMKIQSESFQNTWNAVLIDGDWRLIQCNWGARHLVLNKDKHKEKTTTKSKDHIRYQYDEHYFLTDPDEFIQEFWSKEPEWQLLESPITLEEFEGLPFVRSVFFHYGMHFERGMLAVLETSDKGGCEIKIKIPEDLENDLVFYYQLRFADKERRHEATYRGANLERFVFQTMIDNTVMFSVHVPTTGEYFFEVFANKIEESNRVGSDDSTSVISPFRLKCACKFKIVCNTLSGKMHPLPDCASGEWGPKKGQRHFGVKVKTLKSSDKHSPSPDPNDEKSDKVSDSGSSGSGAGTENSMDNPKAGILNVEDHIELEFKIPRPLHFVPKLKMNDADDKSLSPFVHVDVEGDILKVTVTPPQVGQYGVDLYARPRDAPENTTLSHAFKYLLNCTKVSSPVEIPKAAPKQASKREKWGPTPQFESLGLKCLSHKDPKIMCNDSNQCAIEMFVPETVHMTYQFLKEPDEESREYVSMGYDDNDHQKVKFFINLPRTGNYMLSLFGRLKDADEKSMPNIFNFLIIYKKSSTQTNGNVSKTEERRGSSIFKKGLFKKSEKEKEKSEEKEKEKKSKEKSKDKGK